MTGNTSDQTTLREFLRKIETQDGKAERIPFDFAQGLRLGDGSRHPDRGGGGE